MITLHFHLQPQYKYDLFHIHFTLLHYTGKYELTKLTSLPTCGFIAQLVEHRTGIAEVTGSNPVEALIFFRLLLSNCLNWKIYCHDHFSLSRFFYVLYSDKTWFFDQSEHTQGPIYILRLLQTFTGVLQKKIRTRAVFKETPTNYISNERL